MNYGTFTVNTFSCRGNLRRASRFVVFRKYTSEKRFGKSVHNLYALYAYNYIFL